MSVHHRLPVIALMHLQPVYFQVWTVSNSAWLKKCPEPHGKTVKNHYDFNESSFRLFWFRFLVMGFQFVRQRFSEQWKIAVQFSCILTHVQALITSKMSSFKKTIPKKLCLLVQIYLISVDVMSST